MRIRNFFLGVAASLVLTAFMTPGPWGCGSTTSNSSSTTTTTSSTSTNSLAVTYPSDLAVTSPTASTSSSSSLELAALKEAATATVKPEDFATRKADIQKIIEGTSTAACKFSLDFSAQATRPSCYGPTINYTNHPDAAQGTPSSGQLPQGDVGIYKESEATTGEACVAAQVNYLMGQIDNNVTTATKMGAAILCVANTGSTKLTLPKKGESADLTTQANTVMSTNSVPLTITSAVLSRNASDTSKGDPVYKMTISGTANVSIPGQTAQTPSFTATFTHVPPAASVTSALDLEDQQALMAEGAEIPSDDLVGLTVPDSYTGMMTFKMNMPVIGGGQGTGAFAKGNCSATDGRTESMSIVYNKASATSLTYQLKRALFCGKDASPFATDGTVDLTKVSATGTSGSGWTDDAYYMVATVNPADGTGSFAGSWQAGANDDNTRTIDVTIKSDNTGTGYYGYGPKMTASSGLGSITKMICNWAGPGNTHTGVSKAQRQNITFNTTKKIWESSSTGLAINYAPTNSCNKTIAQNFAYGTQSPPTDVLGTAAVTNSLINLTDMVFTVPTAPTPP